MARIYDKNGKVVGTTESKDIRLNDSNALYKECDNVDEVLVELADIPNRVESLEEGLEEAKVELANIPSSINEVKEDIESLEEELNEVKDTVADIPSRVGSLEEAKVELANEIKTEKLTIGNNTINGDKSVGIGVSNTVNSQCSVAMGTLNTVNNNGFLVAPSFAIGDSNTVTGEYSVAIGVGNTVSSDYQTVIGRHNLEDTEDTYAFIVGNGTRTPSGINGANIHTLDWSGNAHFVGNVSVNGTPTNDNDLVTKKYVDNMAVNGGVNLTDLKVGNSISLGRKEGTTVGAYSVAEGYNVEASGGSSHAEGTMTKASGQSSHAEGELTVASGYSSHAEGVNTTASGVRSHAEGDNTTASGDFSHAEGSYTEASGYYSHAEGYSTRAKGTCSHAEGIYTTATGDFQHVQGRYNIEDTENKYAFIVGNGCDEYIVDGYEGETVRSNAHTLDWEGNGWYSGGLSTEKYLSIGNNTINGDKSVAIGTLNTINSQCSFAMGTGNTVDNGSIFVEPSFAIGDYNTVTGRYSIAIGESNTASSRCQTVIGRKNIADTEDKYVFIVGNGSRLGDGSNAHTLDWNGNAWFSGNVTVGADNKELATKEYVDKGIYVITRDDLLSLDEANYVFITTKDCYDKIKSYPMNTGGYSSASNIILPQDIFATSCGSSDGALLYSTTFMKEDNTLRTLIFKIEPITHEGKECGKITISSVKEYDLSSLLK